MMSPTSSTPAFALSQPVSHVLRPSIPPSHCQLPHRPQTPRSPSTSAPHRHARAPITAGLFDMWSQKPAPTKSKLNFDIGYTYLAHPEKNSGEDAFFVEGNTIGVFDGVSGAFETRGVDPRIYSQVLAAKTRDNVREYGSGQVVKAAINAAETNTEVGASTACVVGMDVYGRVFGINLGDSGVRVIREQKCIFRTKEQQHFFNCPYQLGTDSEDSIRMGQNVQTKVRVGDYLVVATDGLFDNCPDQDIVSVCLEGGDSMEIAERLGDIANERAVDKSYQSPFMKAALDAGVQWQGGKPDDITVVVARITDEDIDDSCLLSTLPETAAA